MQQSEPIAVPANGRGRIAAALQIVRDVEQELDVARIRCREHAVGIVRPFPDRSHVRMIGERNAHLRGFSPDQREERAEPFAVRWRHVGRRLFVRDLEKQSAHVVHELRARYVIGDHPPFTRDIEAHAPARQRHEGQLLLREEVAKHRRLSHEVPDDSGACLNAGISRFRDFVDGDQLAVAPGDRRISKLDPCGARRIRDARSTCARDRAGGERGQKITTTD